MSQVTGPAAPAPPMVWSVIAMLFLGFLTFLTFSYVFLAFLMLFLVFYGLCFLSLSLLPFSFPLTLPPSLSRYLLANPITHHVVFL